MFYIFFFFNFFFFILNKFYSFVETLFFQLFLFVLYFDWVFFDFQYISIFFYFFFFLNFISLRQFIHKKISFCFNFVSIPRFAMHTRKNQHTFAHETRCRRLVVSCYTLILIFLLKLLRKKNSPTKKKPYNSRICQATNEKRTIEIGKSFSHRHS